MTDGSRSGADGPGEAVIDEPTEHALDPTLEPNTEWEQAATMDDPDGDPEDTSSGTSEDTSTDTSTDTSEDEG